MQALDVGTVRKILPEINLNSDALHRQPHDEHDGALSRRSEMEEEQTNDSAGCHAEGGGEEERGGE